MKQRKSNVAGRVAVPAAVLLLIAEPVWATAAQRVPEPGTLGLMGASAMVGVIAWIRSRNGK